MFGSKEPSLPDPLDPFSFQSTNYFRAQLEIGRRQKQQILRARGKHS